MTDAVVSHGKVGDHNVLVTESQLPAATIRRYPNFGNALLGPLPVHCNYDHPTKGNNKLQHSPSLPIVSNVQVHLNPVYRDIHCLGTAMEMHLENTDELSEEAPAVINNISSPDRSVLQCGGCSCRQ